MTRTGLWATLLWGGGCLMAAALVARATYTTDLSGFLPRSPGAAQRLLVEELREGPAAHLIIAAIEGADAATRAQVSAELAARLRSDPALLAVNNGDAAQLQRDRDFIFEHRYLLSDDITPQRFTAEGLRTAISDSLDALGSPEGSLTKRLFTRDPTGEMLAIIGSLETSHAPHTAAGVWSSPDGNLALLVAQTRAAGSDIEGQKAACEALRRAFAAARSALPAARREGLKLLMSGPPVITVAAYTTIKGEVLRLSSVSALLTAILLLAVYRSLPTLALTLVPVATGALIGVAAVALRFPAVHGVTLGFGITLIGEAVDYSVYLFIQSAMDFRRSVWPTIRLGMLTSICGFAALLPSDFTGLAQLGTYSIAGLIAAALVTRFVLPEWRPQTLAIRDLAPAGVRLAQWLTRLHPVRAALLLVLLVAGTVLYMHRDGLWNRELSALSPVPAAQQALEQKLRTDAGAPDLRYVVVAPARDREGARIAAQALGRRLTALVDAGVIGGFESPAQFLPALAVQRARQSSLPPATELRARLEEALAGLPVSPDRLVPFVQDVERARTASLLRRADLAGISLDRAVDTLLVRSEGGWSALLPISAAGTTSDLSTAAVGELRKAVSEVPAAHAQLLDLKGEADRLYSGYLADAVQLALAGLGAIVLLLLAALRSPARVVRVVAPLALSVLAVAATLVSFGERLTIMHVVGMLLIVAVGSNYALFFDRDCTPPHGTAAPLTLASLLVANLATVTTFTVLASSSVPVLADLGETVAPGTLLALLFSALMSRAAVTAPPRAAAIGSHPQPAARLASGCRGGSAGE